MGEMNEKKIVAVGIDPGKTSGAMAIVRPTGDVELRQHTEPLCYLDSIQTLAEIAKDAGVKMLVAVERLLPRPGKLSSAKANFELGRCMGELETMLAMLGVPYQQVTPQAWQKEFGISGDKETHIETARRLYPSVNMKRTEKCKTDFDGYADALLIATWALRRMA